MKNFEIISIDVGAITIGVVRIDSNRNVLQSEYIFHNGKIMDNLYTLIEKVSSESKEVFYCCTGSSKDFFDEIVSFENLVCTIESAKNYFPSLRSLVHVGGEKFYHFRFDENGRYIDMKSSSSCAAGTGAFLDQQSKRLGLKGSFELADIALKNIGNVPKIASRCSVFAKTDLIHAQQEGYSLSEICDGLCLGLANNIADTLFTNTPASPVIFSGGVAKNTSVIKHLENRINEKIEVHTFSHLFGALGAAFLLYNDIVDNNEEQMKKSSVFSLRKKTSGKDFYYPELKLLLSDYPDFKGLESFLFDNDKTFSPVEVDIYEKLENPDVYIGIDIGSTSTKAVVTDSEGVCLAGFYTRTSGQPVRAIQTLFSAIDHISEKYEANFNVKGVATTGSGRKFVGEIIGADLVLDEISAHARAAFALDPEIDTIIEIGGQDAKFTTMRNGVVTFSRMNTVCAAGTGSFIEEQAQKLDVSLEDYPGLVENQRSPLASDRCTVFMERDINHFLSRGYTVNECLTAVLYSIRENYLQKVAVEGAIGNKVCFQGATAKNRALVATFEQKLNKSVYVSKFCHLTGALGSVLTLLEEKKESTRFKGLGIYKSEIPVKTEICNLCLNHCRIRIANVNGEDVAFGFLCGRDYETKKFVSTKKIDSFIEQRNKVLSSEKVVDKLPVLGIPAGLQLYDELYFWKHFFKELKIPYVTSESFKTPVARGKQISDAEFCAPLVAMYGHADFVSQKSDVVFLPVFLEDKPEGEHAEKLRKYCYYSQLSSSIVSQVLEDNDKKLIMPVINYRKGITSIKKELFNALKDIYPDIITYDLLSNVYDNVTEEYQSYKGRLRDLYDYPRDGEIQVAVLGRPYTVLSDVMNKGIPDIFASCNVKTFFQDMLPLEDDKDIDVLLKSFHWSYAASILKAASFCAKTEGIYPVLVTSFKCSPDSFVQEYFTRILDANNKPYLILQIDEHDSNVGYETRIEAAIRSFKNHLSKSGERTMTKSLSYNPVLDTDIKGKTLLLPDWDPITMPLLKAVLQKEKIDARILEETPEKISEGMKTNTGQCIPLNAIVREYVDYMKKYNLKPEDCSLWIPQSNWACNIKMYPYYAKSLLEAEGNGFDKAGVFLGNITQIDFGPKASINTYLAYLFGGILHKFGCRFRPYEKEVGVTDKAVDKGLNIFRDALLGKTNYKKAIEEVLKIFQDIDVVPGHKPKVAIFGDIYVRDNPVMNQNLVRFIEKNGGEVVVTPYNEYAKIISSTYFRIWMKELQIGDFLLYKALLSAMEFIEGSYYSPFESIIGKTASSHNTDIDKKLSEFNLRIEQVGETNDNILKIYHIMENYPDLSFFIHTSPAFCCPSLVTESFAHKIEKKFGVPIVNIIYDGTNTFRNDVIMPYLKYPKINKITKEITEESPGLLNSFDNIFKRITRFMRKG